MMTETESSEKPGKEMMESDICLRSCLQENATPLSGNTTGKIPHWLEGTYIRNGAGLFEIGECKYRHMFDGMSVLHRFHIGDGTVTYSNRFLQSDTYKANIKANRILFGEFGTVGFPDPCQTIWQRFMSRFTPAKEESDNCNVTVCPYGDEIYAASERREIWRIDPQTLDAMEKVDLGKFVAVSHATAHTQVEKDGTVYNIGNSYTKGTANYNIIKFPPPKVENGERISPFKQASILATIPSRWPYSPGYYHSFGMSENYIIFIEQPLCISVPRASTSTVRNASFSENLVWYGDFKTRFYVISKATGQASPVHWESAEPFFFFHTINAYEESEQLVLDICAARDVSVVKDAYREHLEKSSIADKTRWKTGGVAKRFVLPLNPNKEVASGTNLVSLSHTKASASWNKMNQIVCVSEEIPDTIFELPRINYDLNGKKYRYLYGMHKEGLVKIDWETRQPTWWREDGVYPMEPVFVKDPEGTEEDDGVILSALVKISNPNDVDLLMLDAHSFTELARTTFHTAGVVPFTFHGAFLHPAGPGETKLRSTNGY